MVMDTGQADKLYRLYRWRSSIKYFYCHSYFRMYKETCRLCIRAECIFSVKWLSRKISRQLLNQHTSKIVTRPYFFLCLILDFLGDNLFSFHYPDWDKCILCGVNKELSKITSHLGALRPVRTPHLCVSWIVYTYDVGK